MEFYDNKMCISRSELVDSGIMTSSNYDAMKNRGRIEVARSGKGKGRYALVVVDSLPAEYRKLVREKYPGGNAALLRAWVMKNYEEDQHALAFFSSRDQMGFPMGHEKIIEYAKNASVLNCCIKLYRRAKDSQRLFGGKYNWEMMSDAINLLREEIGHTLPTSTLRFRKKVNEYEREGYCCLVSGKFGNQNKRKVDQKTERLVVSLSAMENKPFNKNVHEMYLMFVTDELEVYDISTGELYNPDDFTDKNGDPLYLSESTIANILNNPKNKLLVQYAQDSDMRFMHEQAPHMHRNAGEWALSQISMDDVDLTRKLKDTKQRVHAYYAYDSVSQCVVGASYARKKTPKLVEECFRDMFRLIERNGWGMPAGIEVENHLMTGYKDTLLKAGTVFPFVRFCAPMNSQEKQAEPLNGAKKRSIIHKNHEGIGRFYGVGKWRTEAKKVFDENNDTYEDLEYFTWEQLVADDKRDTYEWNHSLHTDQKRYKGMTRWEVLVSNINPTLAKFDKCTLSRYIGEAVETSVRRNSTVRVDHRDWWLSGTEVLAKLKPNDYSVTAYYLPDEEGRATDVYLYQGDRYIDKVELVETYNRVMAEQTEEDKEKFVAQRKKVAAFNSYVKQYAADKVGVTGKMKIVEPEEVVALPQPAETQEAEDYDTDYYLDMTRRAVADI